MLGKSLIALIQHTDKVEKIRVMRTTLKKIVKMNLFSTSSALSNEIIITSKLIKSLIERITNFVLLVNKNNKGNNLSDKLIRERLSSLLLTQLKSLKERLVEFIILVLSDNNNNIGIRERLSSLLLNSQLNFVQRY